MTTTTFATTAGTTTTTSAHPVRRAALVSGCAAAVATTAVAAAADAAGVSFAIDGETIPLLGFAQMTLVGAALGGLIAAACRRWASVQTFTVVTVLLTALSCVPSVAMPDDVATRLVLVLTHVLAAAIIVPALARQIRR